MSTQRLSLDGQWDFFYSPQAFLPGVTPLPPPSAFTGKMVTPGYWDDHLELFDEEDFFGLLARFNPDYRKVHFPMATTLSPHACTSFLVGTGYYRKMLPAEVQTDGKLFLEVGPAMWDLAVFCNRQLAGISAGYSTATEFDLSGLLRGGEENELLLVVCNVHDDGGAYCRVDGSHDGQKRGARPGQHRGLAAQGYQSERAGIGGGVSLRFAGTGCIADYYATSEEGFPHWHAKLRDSEGATLEWSVSQNNSCLQKGSLPCTKESLEWNSDPLPARWNDKNPVLYDLELRLLAPDGTLWDKRIWQWAPRTVAITKNRILVNGTPVFFNGLTEHCYFPETTNPHFDTEKYLHDLGVLKQAGFNFIRCHTWCPPEPFYDACDRLGFYVQTELPVMYSDAEAEAILRMIRRHACAVVFCEGNEKIIDGTAICRLRRLAETVRRMAPGMLFNPQEAMRGIEYEFTLEQRIVEAPLKHDPGRLAQVRAFSDVFGTLGEFFSYQNDEFPDAATVDEQLAVYGRPCLNHEAGILGGYLDFSLESRYEETYIGTELFQAARANMKRHGVYQYARQYYELNCQFISSIRKQLIENMRSCSNLAGYDYLGGIDTHWHLNGYPCGILNEFYEEKFGETIADVRRYVGPSVLLCESGKWRNRVAGQTFRENIKLSYFGDSRSAEGLLQWCFGVEGEAPFAEGETAFGDVAPGSVTPIATLPLSSPKGLTAGVCATLSVQIQLHGETVRNDWKFWLFPSAEAPVESARTMIANHLTEELIHALEEGGAVLLTGGFPATTEPEHFRTPCTGRCVGHLGVILHEHPVLRKFPCQKFADWQFFPMMTGATSLVQDAEMPDFTPIMELIPSFKLIRRKSVLSEFRVGKGRLFLCGLQIHPDDPAAQWLWHQLLLYLKDNSLWVDNVPEWKPEHLRKRLHYVNASRTGQLLDAGGRPVEKL